MHVYVYQKVTHLKSNYVFNIYYKKYCAPRISGTQQQKEKEWNGKKTYRLKYIDRLTGLSYVCLHVNCSHTAT